MVRTKAHQNVYLDVADALKRGDLTLLRVCASQADFFCMAVLSRRLNAYIDAIGHQKNAFDALSKEMDAWAKRRGWKRRRLSSPPATKTKGGG